MKFKCILLIHIVIYCSSFSMDEENSIQNPLLYLRVDGAREEIDLLKPGDSCGFYGPKTYCATDSFFIISSITPEFNKNALVLQR